LATKFTIFTATLVFWVVATILAYDLRQDTFDGRKGLLLCIVLVLVAGAIGRFTTRLLARPLSLLQAGIMSVRNGRLEPIQVSKTGDEIEFVGDSFNRMIEVLAESQREIRQHQELLEQRIQERTEKLADATRVAEAASEAKSEFLANISHELRTPMNGIIGMIDVTLETPLTAEQAENLKTAQRCAYSLLSLLNEVLDLSKIEAGKMSLERIPFEIRTLLRDCVKSHEAMAARKGVSMEGEIAPSVPEHVIGDPLRIRQIVVNLLSNAAKFTEHGSVVLRADGAEGESGDFQLRIAVRDTGVGIPADKLERIFDKFTQADGTISRKFGGTGLGLAITRKLVELHGGKIEVASEVGVGTTFQLTLNSGISINHARREHAKGLQITASAQSMDDPARILVVEDNQVNQKVVSAVLRKRGFAVEIANDGREALAQLEAAAFDLVLMDVQMPVLDGLEATSIIRQNARWSGLPIVAMTAHAMNGDRERCLAAGMDGYIAKPVHPTDLVHAIEQFLTVKT
jgi:signal transduction histidine kinase/ActR/RegA family two-component response regulator